jgi:glycosyltransferase involved in cell wall biosynthesis
LNDQAAELLSKARALQQAGFFDPAFYATQVAAAPGEDLFAHFFQTGYREGRRPNAVFDPLWYMESYPEIAASGVNPLLDYALFGEKAGRNPSPLFDAQWYRARYKLPDKVSALLHYLRNRRGPFSPIPEFDAEYYLTAYPDVAAAGFDPFEHYSRLGYRELRNPSATFDTLAYRRRYLANAPEVHPLLHYRTSHARPETRPPLAARADAGTQTPFSLVRKFTRPAGAFSEFSPLPDAAARRAKILAFYLTQFHAIPENDLWWGRGFTEWTNVARGQPRFSDHYQPRVPRDLGYYSLDDINVMRRQAAMARAAGIFGFVFYYYWFDGKRLLEKPLENFLGAPDIDMPFCLMWANENWTRRWDGEDQDVLIAQNYGPADDEKLCADFARHFRDSRYIRIGGRPLLMVYRPGLFENSRAEIANWRRIFRERFGETPLLVMAQCFGDLDPRAHGMDGAVEFPPHKLAQDMPNINDRVEIFDPAFEGDILPYDEIAAASLAAPAPEFPLIKTIVPSWDNDSRRQGAGTTIHGSTPEKYEKWLAELVDRAAGDAFFGEPLVCVNAWNEWAEGAYLEPDLHYGAAYLNATARAAIGAARGAQKLLLVGHDAHPHGAQFLLLHIGRSLKSQFGLEIAFLLLGPGPLGEAYAAVAPTVAAASPDELPALIASKKAEGFVAAIVNTVASGDAAPILKQAGMRCILLAHEMPRIVQEKSLESAARRALDSADLAVFPAECVKRALLQAVSAPDDARRIVRPQGNYKRLARQDDKAALLRAGMGVANDAPLVLGAGFADLRKGFDLFLDAWKDFRARRLQVHFCWIGNVDPPLAKWLAAEIAAAKRTGTFHMPGFIADPEDYFSAADVFALTSREDPFPTVALEALSLGVPVVAFAGSGGMAELVGARSLGYVAPFGNVQAFAAAIERAGALAADPAFVARAQELIESEFAFDAYTRDLFRFAMPDTLKISVVTPNYNYAACLAARLDTIFDQSHPVWEVIVLDDASTDNSFDVINETADRRNRDLTLIINERNSGSVFRQWARAVEAATGDFIWIAEADDLAEPALLERLALALKTDADLAFAWCDSRQIDAEGTRLAESYKSYYATVQPGALVADAVFSGKDFAGRFLSVKNLILNVSAVLWRREALARALMACEAELAQFRVAGDWRLYLECLTAPGARVAYVAEPLNIHRRHAQSVTHALDAQRHVEEIAAVQQAARRLCDLPARIVEKQADYLAEIRAQLLGGDSPNAGG